MQPSTHGKRPDGWELCCCQQPSNSILHDPSQLECDINQGLL
jgi:hypothetical protein